MQNEQYQFLNTKGRLPARLTGEQAAWVLNCHPHDIPVLVQAGLLKPLGDSVQDIPHYFATAGVLETAKSRIWLDEMTATIDTHWQKQRAKKRLRPAGAKRNRRTK